MLNTSKKVLKTTLGGPQVHLVGKKSLQEKAAVADSIRSHYNLPALPQRTNSIQ